MLAFWLIFCQCSISTISLTFQACLVHFRSAFYFSSSSFCFLFGPRELIQIKCILHLTLFFLFFFSSKMYFFRRSMERKFTVFFQFKLHLHSNSYSMPDNCIGKRRIYTVDERICSLISWHFVMV